MFLYFKINSLRSISYIFSGMGLTIKILDEFFQIEENGRSNLKIK